MAYYEREGEVRYFPTEVGGFKNVNQHVWTKARRSKVKEMEIKYRKPGQEVRISGVIECDVCGARREGAPFGDDVMYIASVGSHVDPATDTLVCEAHRPAKIVEDGVVDFAKAVAREYLATERVSFSDYEQGYERDRIATGGEIEILPNHDEYYGVAGDFLAYVPTERGGRVEIKVDEDGEIQSIGMED